MRKKEEGDKVKAVETYKDKMFFFSAGIDVDGSKDFTTDCPLIALKADDPRGNANIQQIQIYVNSAENARLGTLKEGQRITILGKCGSSIVIKDAALQ